MKATFSVFRDYAILPTFLTYGRIEVEGASIPFKQEWDEYNQVYWYVFRSRRDWERACI